MAGRGARRRPGAAACLTLRRFLGVLVSRFVRRPLRASLPGFQLPGARVPAVPLQRSLLARCGDCGTLTKPHPPPPPLPSGPVAVPPLGGSRREIKRAPASHRSRSLRRRAVPSCASRSRQSPSCSLNRARPSRLCDARPRFQPPANVPGSSSATGRRDLWHADARPRSNVTSVASVTRLTAIR